MVNLFNLDLINHTLAFAFAFFIFKGPSKMIEALLNLGNPHAAQRFVGSGGRFVTPQHPNTKANSISDVDPIFLCDDTPVYPDDQQDEFEWIMQNFGCIDAYVAALEMGDCKTYAEFKADYIANQLKNQG